MKLSGAKWRGLSIGQVRRIGAASKTKPLYVPATYVTEVPIAPMPSPQRLVASTSLNSNLRILPRVSLSPSPSTGAALEQRKGGDFFNLLPQRRQMTRCPSS